MKKEVLLDVQVSFYRNMKSSIAQTVSVGSVLDAIRGNFYESQIKTIRQLRSLGKQVEADEVKSNLHAVTFCSTFKDRRLSSLCQNYNSLMVIDVDKLDAIEMSRVKNCLEESPVVACYWISPSGAGWKGLVPLCYLHLTKSMDIVDIHHWAFTKLEENFKNLYAIKLDASGKDITRLCFMSWCPQLRLKDEFQEFEIDLDEMKRSMSLNKIEGHKHIVRQSSGQPIMWNLIDGQNQEGRTGNAYDRRLLERIYKYLVGRHESITSSYEDWVKVAFAIAHTFHSVYGRRMFMKFCELDGASHHEERSERLIYDAYTTPDKRCDFSTIIYLAKRKGFVR